MAQGPQTKQTCAKTGEPLLLSVSIVTCRRPNQLAECLSRLVDGAQTLESRHYEVLVSDDCPESSARPVCETFPGVRWIKGPGRGIGANRNHVAKEASGEWIVYLDDDELPEPEWLAHIHGAAVSGQWEVMEGKVIAVNYPDSILWYAPEILRGGMFCTANLAIRARVLFGLGAFDEDLAVSHEDVDLGRRIRSSGLPATFLEQAVVCHPARKLSLGAVLAKAVQQQCQVYWLQDAQQSSSTSRISRAAHIIPWTCRYLYRCLRIQFGTADKRRWRRFILENVVRVACSPWASIAMMRRNRPSYLARPGKLQENILQRDHDKRQT